MPCLMLIATASAHAGVSISGRIVDTDGRPVSGAQVQAQVYLPQQGQPSDDAGRFSVEVGGKPDHVVQLTVRANGYLPWKGDAVLGDEQLDVVLQRGVILRGHVAGDAPPKISFTCALLKGARGPTASVGTDGVFETGGIPTGRAPLAVSAPGRAPLLIAEQDLAGTVDLGVLTLSEGITLDLVLQDSTALPLAGAHVEASWVVDHHHLAHWSATTGPDGAASLTHLRPGELDIRVRHPTTGEYSYHQVDAGSGSLVLTWAANPP